MPAHLPKRAFRTGLLGAALVVAPVLGYFSIRNAAATGFAAQESPEGWERSVRWEPGNARNWQLLGQYREHNLELPDLDRAVVAYRTGLELDPGNAGLWLDLGAAAESQGRLAEAREAFVRARQLYPVSADLSWRYGNFLLRQGELDPAFEQIRRAVQADPKRGAEAFSRAYRATADLEKVLDRAIPPVPSAYLDAIFDQLSEGNSRVAVELWRRLAGLNPKIALGDAFPLVGKLVEDRDAREAWRTWEEAVRFAGLESLEQPKDSILWDGGFESGILGGGFAWLPPPPTSEVQITLDGQEVHSGSRSLRLTFTGSSNLALDRLCHKVAVRPSTTYRFSAWVKPRAVSSDQGVRFRLHSPGAGQTPDLLTSDVRGDLPWTRIESYWTTGKDADLSEVCILRLPSDQPNYRIQGTAWIDDVALVPVTPERKKP